MRVSESGELDWRRAGRFWKNWT